MQDAIWVGKYDSFEVLAIRRERHVLPSAFDVNVVGQLEFDFRDDAYGAVPTNGGLKQAEILLAAGFHDGTIGQYELQGPHGVANRGVPDIAAMRVDRNTSSNSEVGIALHRFDGKVQRVKQILQVTPRHAGLDPGDLFR